MNVIETSLPGVLVIEPEIFRDSRGFFLEAYREERFAAAGLPVDFVQDNHSRSVRNVLRGLHFQQNHPQGKLVTVIHGVVFDVAVDIRVGSPHFGRWTGVELRGDEPRHLWVPPGFAHGFCVLSETADVTYKCTAPYRPDDDRGILWSDPDIDIEWPVTSPLVSPRDAALPRLDAAAGTLPHFEAAATVT